MLVNFKALVVVLIVATIVYTLAKPVWLRFTSPEDFSRRRAVWFVLTIVGFSSPSFWLYALVAVPLMAWAARKDSNPLALYLLLFFVIPPMVFAIPTIGIRRLFDLDQMRLMGFTILLPILWTRVRCALRGTEKVEWTLVDTLFVAYGLLQLVLLVPYESGTNTLRRAFLFFLDGYLVYFAFSRSITSKAALADIMGALCLSGCILAPLAVFESLWQWLLYTGIPLNWGSPNMHAWLFRGDSLRAQVSTGHSIPLGYVLALAIGCWMCMRSAHTQRWVNPVVFVLLFAGVYFSHARGPWLAAAFVPFLYFALSSHSAARFAKSMLVLTALVAPLLATPLGGRIVANLPIIGSVGQETIEYRQQLAETSWRLIQQNPWFGNPFVLLDMEELRQGQGIIDIVNAFATVALYYGLIGLALFVGVFVAGLTYAYRGLRLAKSQSDTAGTLIGASLIACMIATLFVMAAGGFAWLQWPFVGLIAGYGRLLVIEGHGGAAVVNPSTTNQADSNPSRLRSRFSRNASVGRS